MKIKLCKYTPKIKSFEKKLSQSFSNASIIVKSCIKMCNRCERQPVAKVAGQKIKGKTIEKVIAKIAQLNTKT